MFFQIVSFEISDSEGLEVIGGNLEIRAFGNGRFVDGGFVAHDLRHNFGTRILRHSDIETTRELLGHANISQTATYVHTSSERLREAVRKNDKIDYNEKLKEIFSGVKKDEINEADFVERMRKLFRF